MCSCKFGRFPRIGKGIICKFQVTLSWQILRRKLLEMVFLLFFKKQNGKTGHKFYSVRVEAQFCDMFIFGFIENAEEPGGAIRTFQVKHKC